MARLDCSEAEAADAWAIGRVNPASAIRHARVKR